MLIVGLTGGIASGKSTVSKELARLGAKIVDADKIAWQLAEPDGAIWQAYVERYGASVINKDRSLNRQAVADRVFSDKNELEWMNFMAHPLIQQECSAALMSLKEAGCSVAVLDVPLLFETGWNRMVDIVWVVYVTQGIQLKRLMERNGFDEAEAKRRMAAQMSLEKKKRLADVVIDNNGSLAELLAQVGRRWNDIDKNEIY